MDQNWLLASPPRNEAILKAVVLWVYLATYDDNQRGMPLFRTTFFPGVAKQEVIIRARSLPSDVAEQRGITFNYNRKTWGQ